MAIKEVTVTVPQDGADKGKRFVITRMSAIEADKWGRHCLQAAIASGADIPGVMAGAGLAGVAAAGLNIFGVMDPARMDALIDELMRCISVQPDPANPALRRALHDSDIEEIPTVGWLQKEAFALHVDFFKGVSQLFSLLSLMLGAESTGLSPDTQTSANATP
ncbi:hypothetical protein K2X14_11605 [Acetobacter sp. TBRC 12305]|uniref:Tail assembly chaperone n=1 Tax=Acetobacter garciniae TaxID=2817435 RepID=A0A939KQG2_9PROT|nr:hypothetical protein [Acetobacter garciniae]MBO1325344.1 hypothetical protein [Acetobacter garciniae]MBX0345484.1 hypothetical protein [Acetobacter garciniae]